MSEARKVQSMTELAMVFHNHQPVGNFPDVIDRAVDRAYLPLLRLLGDYPTIRVTLHYSGSLLLELQQRHPVVLEMIADLVRHDRAELLTSGFGEPIMPAIPAIDRIRQLQRMNRELHQTFDTVPLGAWVTERVFDPACVPQWLNAGVRYLLLDDCHMLKCGLPPGSPAGPWRMITPAGAMLIFFSDSRLRNEMPWGDVDQQLRILEKHHQAGGGPLAVGDDGEKFGDWPGTHELCYGRADREGWLSTFFSGLETLSGDVNCCCLRELLDRPPLGDVQVPAGSYHEMNIWAAGERRVHPATALTSSEEKMVQPASWFHFPVRYREAGSLLSRIQELSRAIVRIHDKEIRARAEQDLHLAECNCAWWHGVFGGVYLPHLRMALHEKRISAGKTVDWYFSRLRTELQQDEPSYAARKELDALRSEYYLENYTRADLTDALYTYPLNDILQGRLEEVAPVSFSGDFDFDGEEELCLRGTDADIWIDPAEGGSVFGLDLKQWNYDALAVMSRYREPYHRDWDGTLAVPRSVPLQVYDANRRTAFRDRLLAKAERTDLENLSWQDLSDFANGNWQQSDLTRDSVTLEKDCTVLLEQGSVALNVCKKYQLQTGGLQVEYQFSGDVMDGFFFVPEINLMLMATDGNRHLSRAGVGHSLAESMEFPGGEPLEWIDPWLGFRLILTAPEAIRFLHVPVYTLSRNFDEFEAIFQGITLWPVIDPQKTPCFTLGLSWADA